MYKTVREPEQKCVVIDETHMQHQGLRLEYRLEAIARDRGTEFEMEVVLNAHERARAMLGCDLDSALFLYRRICRGTVPPCTLAEIVHELQQELLRTQELWR